MNQMMRAGTLRDIDITGTLEKDLQIPKHCNKTQPCTRKSQSNFSNCNNSCVTITDEHCVNESPKVPLAARRSKGGDVWNYLRRISFIGKGGSTLLEKSFDSMYTLDKTIDSDYGSVDLDCIKNLNPAPKPSGPDVKSGHFRGLFRFFNSVAETARKWRNSSRSFTPREGDCSPVDSPQTQRIQNDELHTKSTTPDLCDVVSTAARSPNMVPKSWKSCPDSSSTTGFSDGTESQLTSTHTSLATIENHQRSDGAEGSSLSETELQTELQEHSDVGSETSDRVRNQTNHEKRCISSNGQIVPDCPEELFKALSRPPGMSPQDPPFKEALQRCRSLPLTQNSVHRASLSLALPVGCGGKSDTIQMRSESTSQRKLLRPGSGSLQVNHVSIIFDFCA
ncbi:uncharacterized protein LOC134319655 [Trichomycterus rosablanca]|uniref:uncharacterized protein LOC134319655 n=1 Tax=Trichomycterus rosablanca TaxID=2290929 RepID=UPI002F3502C2